jgi:NADH:ubiquinone oxidoreductase subunit 6 (subunit J)
MQASAIVFYILAVIIIASALKMVVSTNLVHSALFMVLAFIGVAGIFITLYADYLALVQILVYVGAISVLLVFGVMMTKRGDIKESNLFNKYKIPAVVVCFAIFTVITYFVFHTDFIHTGNDLQQGSISSIANLLFNDYLIPFEIAGVLLLVALVGAIIIGKGENNTK